VLIQQFLQTNCTKMLWQCFISSVEEQGLQDCTELMGQAQLVAASSTETTRLLCHVSLFLTAVLQAAMNCRM